MWFVNLGCVDKNCRQLDGVRFVNMLYEAVLRWSLDLFDQKCRNRLLQSYLYDLTR
uniref:Uncharacterized protein n=1 Tax=Arion vulgaris TaxID=1028688 RepID=A0A0B7AE42_9EUPU